MKEYLLTAGPTPVPERTPEVVHVSTKGAQMKVKRRWLALASLAAAAAAASALVAASTGGSTPGTVSGSITAKGSTDTPCPRRASGLIIADG